MKLISAIKVGNAYTRSVNVERDTFGGESVGQYIPTSRSLLTLSRLSDTLHGDVSQRAWSLVGPYGSGKSSFAVFTARLFGDPKSKETQAALEVLASSDFSLAEKLSKSNTHYLQVCVTGSPEPLTKKLLKALLFSVESLYVGHRGKRPNIIKEITLALAEKEVTVSMFMGLIEALSLTLKNKNMDGILLVIDELGKFLEYEARHYGANDIFLLQALAEKAAQGSDFNIVLFALLHQSFDQYAKGLGESLKNEWGKIQGRFEEVPFLESEEQTLRVVSAAVKQGFDPQQQKEIEVKVTVFVEQLAAIGALPGALESKKARELFMKCYPLHPVTAMLLPGLCQKIAQNERTLFSYLGSQEENGFVKKLRELEVGEFIMPADVYDYFVANQSSVMGDYAVHRRWVEVQTAIERLGDANAESIRLLKTIGLFNIRGSKGEFKASEQLLLSLGFEEQDLRVALKALTEKSVINYRQFSGEYRVWQGSDFDLELALQRELDNLGNFALAEELNQSDQLLPIVARKYSIETGALRYFDPIFVDAKNYLEISSVSLNPRVILFLAFGEDDKKYLIELSDYFSDLDVIVLCGTSEKLRDAVAEVICLRKIQSNSAALNSDPVANREFEDRLFTAAATERMMLQSFLDSPEKHQWSYEGNLQPINSKRDLQASLSLILEGIYYKTPIIHNELINRDRPSSQSNSARNKLLYAMQESGHRPDLGIDKFPAEKAIYRALLKETGIHHIPNELSSNCTFRAPKPNQTRVHHVWQRIDKFLESTEKEPRSFVELNDILMAPPYGVKAGLLPILYFASYLVNERELALYENRRYRPHFSKDMIERFTKRPDGFTVQRFRIAGLRESIFRQYRKVLGSQSEDETLLSLAKPLATFMGSLPGYTQKTRRGLSPRAQKVRTAFNLAKSPERLLFNDLPIALGYEDLEGKDLDELEEFSQHLIHVLRELKDAHENMCDKQRRLLSQVLSKDADVPLIELRNAAKQLYGLEEYSSDTRGLNAFITRLTKVEGDIEAWFENILMFLGRKPSKTWLDTDQDTAEYRLNDYAAQILELKKLRLQVEEKGGVKGEVDFLLLKTIRKGEGAKDEVVMIDDPLKRRVTPALAKIRRELGTLDSRESILAVVASLTDEVLREQGGEDNKNAAWRVVDGGKSDE